MICGKKTFDQPIKNDFKTHNSIQKIETVQGDDCTTSCLLDYNYFENHCRIIAIDYLSKQQKLDPDPEAIQQVNFNWNLNWVGTMTMFLSLLKKQEKQFQIFYKKRWEYYERVQKFIFVLI